MPRHPAIAFYRSAHRSSGRAGAGAPVQSPSGRAGDVPSPRAPVLHTAVDHPGAARSRRAAPAFFAAARGVVALVVRTLRRWARAFGLRRAPGGHGGSRPAGPPEAAGATAAWLRAPASWRGAAAAEVRPLRAEREAVPARPPASSARMLPTRRRHAVEAAAGLACAAPLGREE